MVLVANNFYLHQPLDFTTYSILIVIVGMSASLLLLASMIAGMTMLTGTIKITATEYDLQMQKGLLTQHVAWQQASLFALGVYPYGTLQTLQWVELSSATTILRWPDEAGPTKGDYLYFVRTLSGEKSAYRRVSQEAYCAASAYLNSYIAQKTGLALLDVRALV
ncbi:hypothetical protein KDK_62250 [Dictyobacter kobayashii]|uniref:Uncharacterized protein n=2 Tax=Dictyobacter kobayashii TaxID=2014872 RepID=A0A402ATN2_9CHLR|nr:hypothetical protein KDK_62250 [Dictyobacter kobayashii]